jgi:hypothetical protein
MMMTNRFTQISGSTLLVLSVLASAGAAQSVTSVRMSSIYESYSYDNGLPFDKINQFSTPLAISVDFGRLGTLAISTGFTQVKLNVTDNVLGDQDVSGVIDSDVRWTFEVVPGRLYAIASGTIPTGINRVSSDELSILGVLASDVVGFAAPSIGTGGNVGGGFVAAVPVGSWALGVGGTYRAPLRYRPIDGNQSKLSPGAEIRVRAGLEGSVGARTYVRMAAVLASRQNDRFGGDSQSVGNRAIGYISVNQGMGNMTATGYVFDVFRSDPQAQVAVMLPRGNLLALGGRLEIPVNPQTSVVPNLEYRLSHTAASITDTNLRRNGGSVRGSMSVRRRMSSSFGVVAEGSYLTGSIEQNQTIGMTGFRGALHLEWIP